MSDEDFYVVTKTDTTVRQFLKTDTPGVTCHACNGNIESQTGTYESDFSNSNICSPPIGTHVLPATTKGVKLWP